MNIITIPVTKINPAPYNPRVDLQPGDPEYEKLKRSMNEFGYVEPLIWNERSGNLVGGHQRLKVLMEQSPQEVKVSVVDLDAEKEKALNLALNKVSGDWDEYKLQQLLQELSQTDLDLSITGFDNEEIDNLIEEMEAGGTGTFSQNQELELDDFGSEQFEHTCPKCGFTFNDSGDENERSDI